MALHGDLPVHLLCGLAGNTPFLIGGGADALSMGCFSGNQPALLEQFVHKFGYKLIPDLISPVLVTQTADFKMFRNVDRNGSYDIKIAALCPAFFQDITCDLPPLGLQLRPVCFIADIPIFLIAVNMITAKGFRF